VGVFYFLNILPDTGLDYSSYEITFENSRITSDFPYFETRSAIVSEPLYLWYNSFLGVVLNRNFQLFLGVNFLLCLTITFYFFKSSKLSLTDFWFFSLPVIIPTIFYFSPRSSISYVLAVAGVMYLTKRKTLLALILFLCVVSIHSQYILQSFLILVLYFLVRKSNFKNDNKIRVLIITSSVIFSVILRFIEDLIPFLSQILSVLPSSNIATAKLHYLEESRSGYRLTSLLSIVIYPIGMYFLYNIYLKGKINLFKNKTDNRFLIILLFGLIFYGAAINIAYFDNPHLAGRLSRLSDYMGLGILTPVILDYVANKNLKKLILFIIILLAPILFSSIYYNVTWNIF